MRVLQSRPSTNKQVNFFVLNTKILFKIMIDNINIFLNSDVVIWTMMIADAFQTVYMGSYN